MKQIIKKAFALTFGIVMAFVLCGCDQIKQATSEIVSGIKEEISNAVSEFISDELGGLQSQITDGITDEFEGLGGNGSSSKDDTVTSASDDDDWYGGNSGWYDDNGDWYGDSCGAIDENGTYDSKEEVALYIHTYGKLPSNYITKKEAEALGWEAGSLEPYAPGKCIGGSRFGNYEELLPDKDGRIYTECDIDTLGASSRGAKRIVFSNDGLVYYTEDHYETFECIYGE